MACRIPGLGGLSLRRVRLKAVWLLVLPFLWLARPTPYLLLAGAVLAAVGLVLRGWAAGFIHKEKELTTGGPYAHTRNPLYLGSLLIGLGVTMAGGRWVFVALFTAFFVAVYGRAIRSEARILDGLFGERYRDYAAMVPLLLPSPRPYRRRPEGGSRFDLGRYRQNREYEALLGVLGGFAFLAARMYWGG